MLFNATFNNISVILWCSVLLVEYLEQPTNLPHCYLWVVETAYYNNTFSDVLMSMNCKSCIFSPSGEIYCFCPVWPLQSLYAHLLQYLNGNSAKRCMLAYFNKWKDCHIATVWSDHFKGVVALFELESFKHNTYILNGNSSELACLITL